MPKTLYSIFLAATLCCLPLYTKNPLPPKSDAAFLAMAAEADMTLAHIGQMAEDRAANTKLKNFGETLVQDHTGDYQSLSILAGKMGDTIPKAIDKINTREITGLDRYHGKSFDHAFLLRESAVHQKLAAAFRREAEHGSNPDIKAYATKALPTIERHLHETQDLMKQRS
jgi:putative membrane protein